MSESRIYRKTGGAEKDFEETVGRLEEIPQFMALSGRERAEQMLALLGHPERELKIIHVAGTNGKGSVCAYLERILRENGYTTGLFTSPHLVDIRERICMNGKMIDRQEFVRQYQRVRCVDEKLKEKGVALAYFDYLLGMALCVFAEAGLDYVVMETGLGGRLDATNAVANPVLCILTSISLEHTALLGDTVEKIAEEKAGIMKAGIPVVYVEDDSPATDVIAAAAVRCGAPAVPVAAQFVQIHKNTGKRIDFSLHNGYYKNDCFSVPTGAVYQVQNCSLALTAAAVLNKYGMAELREAAIHAAVRETFWAGRMEEVCCNVFVDGAHNPDGIECLIETAQAISKGRKCRLLFSVVNDKDYEDMIRRLCTCGVFDGYVVTQVEGKRQLADTSIQQVFKRYTDCPVYCFDSVREAYLFAQRNRTQETVLICTGSLYLVGEIKAITAGEMAEQRL